MKQHSFEKPTAKVHSLSCKQCGEITGHIIHGRKFGDFFSQVMNLLFRLHGWDQPYEDLTPELIQIMYDNFVDRVSTKDCAETINMRT